MDASKIITKRLNKGPLQGVWLAKARECYREAGEDYRKAVDIMAETLQQDFDGRSPMGATDDGGIDRAWDDIIADVLEDTNWCRVAEGFMDDAATLEDAAKTDAAG